MNTEDAARIRSAIFGCTSPVALDVVGSLEEDMWQTREEAERGMTDAAPYGWETAWSRLGARSFDDEAPGLGMDAVQIRTAYDIVNGLDEDALADFEHNEADGLVTRIKEEAKGAAQSVTCPRCAGKMGFSKFSHVPHKHVGGLCYQCDGKGVIPVSDAEKYMASKAQEKSASLAKARARADEEQAKEQRAHDEAYDRYGDEYRLVYALARYDHRATMGCVFDINAYRSHDDAAMRRVRDRLEYIVRDAGLWGLGLEEIEALGTIEIGS